MSDYLKNIALFALAVAASGPLAVYAGDFQAQETQTLMQQVIPEDNAEKQELYNYLLNEQGIDIIEMGEIRTIVISSDALFVPGSANLNKDYARYLKWVARLVNTYDTTLVSISAYTNQKGDIARALTERQAQRVLTDLEKFGVTTNLIYAKGYGNASPVSIKNQSVNRRIEISFQFYPQAGTDL